MENFNYNSLDYLTVTRKLLDDTVWTTIKDRFVGDSGSGDGVIAHGSEWFSGLFDACLLYTSPSPRDAHESRMPSSA